ncbi:heavy-metal-associated domain-containing protein [Massilia sp. GCM10020059]|uniref:Heavy-metal-associated domain-containing protein n=1 Tax=Massilia agrisoli TaxID=2892444 RepID=A0ABS8IQD3_9BURK|nr:heavy-metal-associated domain-containing protein [Massilia agrisoli]MCC6070835.1 heavy-metal-associated domain-containing protein [Massilia agrisoli]
MIKLSIPDMSCGHCTGVINKTVKELDAGAAVEFDLTSRTATINTSADPAEVCDALEAAGYPAALVQH